MACSGSFPLLLVLSVVLFIVCDGVVCLSALARVSPVGEEKPYQYEPAQVSPVVEENPSQYEPTWVSPVVEENPSMVHSREGTMPAIPQASFNGKMDLDNGEMVLAPNEINPQHPRKANLSSTNISYPGYETCQHGQEGETTDYCTNQEITVSQPGGAMEEICELGWMLLRGALLLVFHALILKYVNRDTALYSYLKGIVEFLMVLQVLYYQFSKHVRNTTSTEV